MPFLPLNQQHQSTEGKPSLRNHMDNLSLASSFLGPSVLSFWVIGHWACMLALWLLYCVHADCTVELLSGHVASVLNHCSAWSEYEVSDHTAVLLMHNSCESALLWSNWVTSYWNIYLKCIICNLFTFLVPAHLGSPGKGPLNGCVYM